MADSDLGKWELLNPKGREKLLKRFTHKATDNTLEWDWDATPFNRVALMNRLARSRPNASYLEIGCNANELFHALPLADKTGVDPARGGTHRMTSDEFFAENRRQFDLIFIDGLHEYEQARRDVQNAIDALAPGGWIGMHDLLPRSWLEAHVPRLNGLWTGDVWKAGVELAATPGLEFRIVLVDHGVGLIRPVKETNPVLADLRSELSDAEFDQFYSRAGTLPLMTWDETMRWLGEVDGN